MCTTQILPSTCELWLVNYGFVWSMLCTFAHCHAWAVIIGCSCHMAGVLLRANQIVITRHPTGNMYVQTCIHVYTLLRDTQKKHCDTS